MTTEPILTRAECDQLAISVLRNGPFVVDMHDDNYEGALAAGLCLIELSHRGVCRVQKIGANQLRFTLNPGH